MRLVVFADHVRVQGTLSITLENQGRPVPVDEATLDAAFGEYGEIMRIVPSGPPQYGGPPRPALVTFFDSRAQQLAFDKLNGQWWHQSGQWRLNMEWDPQMPPPAPTRQSLVACQFAPLAD
jgi:hypothetical protein